MPEQPVWSIVLFLPMLNVGAFPVVMIITVVLTLTNLIYAYVRERNGLAAAWVCQMIGRLHRLFPAVLGKLMG
ncbi:MAG: hypothetical protein V9E89_03650 [Ilumatobacteraceae bacterium]